MIIKLWYLPCNNGDGSVTVRFFSTEANLRAYQKAEEESPYYEGWGEDCANSIEVEVAPDGTVSEIPDAWCTKMGARYRRLDPVFES